LLSWIISQKGLVGFVWIVVSVIWIAMNLAERLVPILRRSVDTTLGSPQASNVAYRRITITLTDALRDRNLAFGVLHVRDGKDEVPGHGDLINEVTPFRATERSGTIEATIKYQRNLGFQYKCFVELLGSVTFDQIKQSLTDGGFENISQDGENDRRIWFTLEGKPTYVTIDKFINNFAYPNSNLPQDQR
jgi:hypothetical protein